MFEAEYTFNNHIKGIIENNFQDFKFNNEDIIINFYPEPFYEKINYPAIVLHYQGVDKTDTLAIMKTEVQFDILVDRYNRALLNKITDIIMQELNVTADVPGRSRIIQKYQYHDETTGEPLEYPLIYPKSGVRWELSQGVQQLYEREMPELMRNSFSLDLFYKDA